MSRTAALVLLFTLAAAPPTYAQDQDQDSERWQITRENGEFLWDIQLTGLRADSLGFRKADSAGAVVIADIRELRLIRKTTMRLGEADGATATLSALIGGDDEIFDFGGLDFAERLKAIQQVLLRHPVQR